MSTHLESDGRWTTECDVAFILALREELLATDIFQTEAVEPVPNDIELEIHSRQLLDARGQRLRLLTVLLDDQGPENAAIATTKFLQRVEPKLLVLVGISGRVSSDCQLGDVVLATVCDNTFYRAKKKSGETLPGGREWPLDALATRLMPAIAAAPAYYSYSGLDEVTIQALRIAGKISETPKTLHGAIATTPFLVDDPEFAEWLQTSRNRNILATDMESAAVVQAAHASGIRNGRVLVVRGISDLADGTKASADAVGRGAIRKLAMQNAAQLASHCISRLITFHDDGIRVKSASAETADESLSPYADSLQALRDLADGVDQSRSDETRVCSEIASLQGKNGLVARQLSDLANATYQQEIERKGDKHRALLQLLPRTAIDFLTAKWIMDSLSRDEPTSQAVEILSKVYPQRINRFCKAFLNVMPDERRLVDSLVRAYGSKIRGPNASRSQEMAKAHICYLMGRLRSPQQRVRAAEVLHGWRRKLVPSHLDNKPDAIHTIQLERTFAGINSPERRLLLRTICISLVLLDQPGESELYVRACLRSKEFDSLNRGFHLEYYGDIDYDPGQSMNNTDPVTAQWTRTFETLLKKLSSSYSRLQPYALRDVELQTLLSLAQHRHAAQSLESSQRLRLVKFLTDFPLERLTSIRLLQAFAEMLSDLLQVEHMRRADLIRKLCELKKVPRSGWNDKTARHVRDTPNPESVLSHTTGGLILIHFCLPERLSREDRQQLGGDDYCRSYSKDEIAKIFLTHDLAEAYTGDLLPNQRNDETRADEQRINSRIDLFSTWPGFYHFGMYNAWNDFENAMTINGRIAKEIDALENLLQLTIELESPDVTISDAVAWRDDVARRISTPMGRRILEMLLE